MNRRMAAQILSLEEAVSDIRRKMDAITEGMAALDDRVVALEGSKKAAKPAGKD